MTEVKSIRALSRGLKVLEWLGTRPEASLAQIHTGTGLSKATLLRILKTLGEGGWIHRNIGNGNYRVSNKAVNFSDEVRPMPRIAELATPILQDLCDRVVWPSDLAVFDGRSMLILETSRLKSPFLVNRDVVGIRPGMLHSALGRAYLAFCPDEERREILEMLRRSPNPDDRISHNQAWVERVLRATAAQGFGERELGYWTGNPQQGKDLNAIAVPVLCHGRVLGCINMLWISGSIKSDHFVGTYLPHLKDAAALLSRSVEMEGAQVDN